MKKLTSIIIFFLFTANLFSQDYKQTADGIEYAEMMRGTQEQPIRLNLLRLDLTKVRLDVVHALDTAIGLEKTSSIASRHGAIAAINAGFFKMEGLYKGDAAGILQIDKKLLSESFANRIALGILNEKEITKVDFMHLNAVFYGAFAGDREFSFTGANRDRKSNDVILFTPEFHRTTLTDSNGIEIILSRCANHSCQNSVVVEGKGSSIIPTDGFVISIGKDAIKDSQRLIKFAKSTGKNKHFSIIPSINPIEKTKQNFLEKTEDIIAGVPQLIKNGKIEITWEQEKIGKSFVETKHPRTAVAKLKDEKFLMVTVDGRQPNHSVGMNLQELAELLLELGATDAMNLDGGGSTTMFVNGKVMNKPSDKEGERSVSDAILVFPRKKQ